MLALKFIVFSMIYTHANSQTFTTTLTKLGLSPDQYFDASKGVQVSGSPTSSLLCEEGNHYIRPWWISGGTGNSTGSNETASTLSPAVEAYAEHFGSDDIYVLCDHTCPTVQYTTPEGQPVSYYNSKGYYGVEEQLTVYPIHIQPSSIDISFIRDYSDSAAFNFVISLDLQKMMETAYSQFLVLEGKLETTFPPSVASVPDSTTFHWTVRRNSHSYSPYSLDLTVVRGANVESYASTLTEESAKNISLAIRHISQNGASTCFYMNGSRKRCIFMGDNSNSKIAFVILPRSNSLILLDPYPRNYKTTFVGTVHSVKVYRIKNPQAIISESEIWELSNPTQRAPACVCQSTSHPFMTRILWASRGNFSSPYDGLCYSNTTQSSEAAAVPRLNDNNHGIEQAFDGNLSTRWITMSGEDKISAVLRFRNKIKVLAIGLALSVLPEQINVYSPNDQLIGTVQPGICAAGNSSCTSWSELLPDQVDDQTSESPPVISWRFADEVVTDRIVVEFVRFQEEINSFYIINDISIIATCYCEGGESCVIDPSATVHTNGHKCDCSLNHGGANCETCAQGYYPLQTFIKDEPEDTCEECQCDTHGTCEMIYGECKTQRWTERCDSRGHCYCRRLDKAAEIDTDNPKCSGSLLTIEPSYGPLAGGTEITLTGDYILGYTDVIFSDPSSGAQIQRQASQAAAENSEETMERLVLLTPAYDGEDNQTNVSVALSAQISIQFQYRDNPVIDSFQFRNSTLAGGLPVKVKGQNLDSVAKPKLLTIISCSHHSAELVPPVESDCDVNQTMMICITPNLTDILANLGCSTNRQRRFIDENQYSNFSIALGLKFDGFMDYRNVNNYFNVSEDLTVSPDPSITRANINNDDQTLLITGSYLASCCYKNDYTVTVDNKNCDIDSISDTEIRCELGEGWKVSSDSRVTVNMSDHTIYSGPVAPVHSDDSTTILAVPIAAGATVLILIILVCVQSCVYYKHYYHGQTTTKIMVRDIYRARQANSRDYTISNSSTSGNFTLQPSYYFTGPNVDDDLDQSRDNYAYLNATEGGYQSSHNRSNNNQGYYLRQLSDNNYSNRGYYEIEI